MFFHHYTHIDDLRRELEENFLKWGVADLQDFMNKKFHPLLESFREFTSETDPIRQKLEDAYMRHFKDALATMKAGGKKENVYDVYILIAVRDLREAHDACHKLSKFFHKVE